MVSSVVNKQSVGKSAFSQVDARCILLIAFVGCISFLPLLGSAGLFDPTDSFFIESGREMLETQKFIVPLMNYEQWLDKPALDFCLIATSLKLFGVSEFAGRLPAALSGILEAILLFVLSRQILTVRQSLFSALSLLAFPLFIIVGRTSLSDEPLSLCFCCAVLSLAIASIKKRPIFLVPGYIGLGLAILLKGPPLALIFTGLAVGGYLLLAERANLFQAIWNLRPLVGLLAAAAIALPYYIWAHVGTNGEFTVNFFLRQNLGRAAGTVNHVRPFWWYVPVFLAGIFPWSLMLLTFSQRFFHRILHIDTARSTPRVKLLKFAACWAALGFCFFSAVPTKLETYIVPILPAVALLCGSYLDVLARAARSNFARRAFIACLSCVAAVVIITPIATKIAFKDAVQLFPLQLCAAGVLLIACGMGIRESFRSHLSRAGGWLLGAVISYCAVFIPVIFVTYHDVYQSPIDKLVTYAHDEHADLAVLFFSLPSVMYRYGHAIPLIKDEQDMRNFAEGAPDKRWVLMNRDVLSLLKWTERSPRVVAHEGRWWLFAVGKNCKKENTAEWNGLNVGVYPTLADRSKMKF
ncbi:MAG TPA: glycosyltransferase family 39 protein [Oculatellaceae cyanobacterium]